MDAQVMLQLSVDNSVAITLACTPTYSSKTRHIELRWHYVRDQIKKGLLTIVKVHGTKNPADMFTKALPKTSSTLCRSLIGMQEQSRGCSGASVGGGVLSYATELWRLAVRLVVGITRDKTLKNRGVEW
ncbi:unnamed protein product [Peronospora belbahrii]|uniref:Copia protein n=1 Tax=Peronospora belbahrii TaxID=622444 RepID=A0ABN8DBF9_9STRA|nr:unnamed protein product [Peronospora belbahrii]CAH0522155.1 unnamed protein product [Peronospora belbahrii]